MNARMVLMCGGVADGRWVTVEPGVRDWECVAFRINFRQDFEPLGPAPERVRYRIQPVKVIGHELWVGVCEDEAYDDRAVLRAILQRDVAAHLGAYR